jgi:hypothetical protein
MFFNLMAVALVVLAVLLLILGNVSWGLCCLAGFFLIKIWS